MDNRRNFLKKGALLGLTGLVGSLAGNEKLEHLENMTKYASGSPTFKLPPLPYAYDALEPFIDKQTMEIHYTKHHQAYIDKLNNAPSTDFDYQVDDQKKCKNVNQNTALIIRNNLGGYYNHCLFWLLLKPNQVAMPIYQSGRLADAIKKGFRVFRHL